MKSIRFLLKYASNIPRSRFLFIIIVLAGVLNGIVNAILIALVNSSLNNPTLSLLWPFLALCLALPATRMTSQIILFRLSTRIIFNLRVDLSQKILSTPYRDLQELGPPRLLAVLTEDIPAIARALIAFPALSMQIVVIIGGLVYLAWLSWQVFLGVLVMFAIGIFIYQGLMRRSNFYLTQTREEWDQLYGHFRTLTDGIKELKLHYQRRQAFVRELLEPSAAAVRDYTAAWDTAHTTAVSWGQVLFFVLVGIIIFGSTSFTSIDSPTLTGYILTILYLTGPLQVILNLLPSFTQADVAVQKVENVGLSLAKQGNRAEIDVPPLSDPNANWQRIELRQVSYAYASQDGGNAFSVGPMDLIFQPGEIVFLTGGNGSGKTTLAYLLSGLYVPDAGQIFLDNEPITESNREYYRQYFSVVFADSYLFTRFLGLNQEAIEKRANAYLVELKLDDKVEVKDNALSTTDLSYGQKKRLALLTAYLEDRPFYLFDEWAADQDPVFRKIFYYHILPELKARGKAVVVISHDDHYYDIADRIIKINFGRLEYDRVNGQAGLLAQKSNP